MKTFQNFIETLTEKALTNAELHDLIGRATDAVRGVLSDNKKSSGEKQKAKEVLSFIRAVDVSLEKDGKLHPNTVNGLMRIVAGVGSGKYGWASGEAYGRVPAQYRS